MATSAARQKKPTTKTASRPSTRAKTKKPSQSRWNTFFTRRYAKPAVFVLFFALIGGGITWWAMAATTTYSLWSDSTVPHTITANDPKSVELGVRFHAKVAGYITGIRFYKGAQNTGTHVGTLWDKSGHILAQATFTNETSNGWQSVTFAQPVSVAANVTYIASYFAPNGHYSANNFYFQSTGHSNNNLVAPRSGGSAPNGVYLYNSRGGFPTQTYQATNYWVDVMFNSKLIAPQPAPSAPTALNATLQGTSVNLSWQASTGSNPITSYNVIRGGSKIGTSSTTSFTDSNTTAGSTYRYQVQAVDSTGTTSALSTAVSVTIPSAPPTPTPTPPTPPTPPSPPVTQPQAGSFPTADNTGAAACGSLPKQVQGDVVIGDANTVYQDTCVKGTLVVTACNVTIKNVEVDTGETVGNSGNDLFAIWAQEPETCPLTIDHVSVITNPAPNNFVTTGIRVARGGVVNISNSKLLGVQLGVIGYGAGTMQGNYMELGVNPKLDWMHNEDVEISGSDGVVMNDNTFLNQNDQTSALSILTEWGANTNLTVTNNLVAGGIYTVYAGGGLCSNAGTPTPEENAKFVNNVFWERYFPNVGSAGEARDFSPAGGGLWSGNVYMNADGTLTTQQVPQAPPDTQDIGKC